MSSWIGETYTSDVGWRLLEALVDLETRMAGSDGERLGAELTRDALADVGARDTRLEPFEIQGWTRGESSIRVDGAEQDCIALPRSPSAEVTGEFVDVGYGLPEDFERRDLAGTVVMAASNTPDHERYIHRQEKYYRAVEADAAAFVYCNHVPGCLPPTGSVGTDDEPIGEIPAVGVSREAGARLTRRFDGADVTVAVEAEIHDATSQNVHAELGPETDERVLVTSHVDAHDIAEGAMDNGAGTAMIVELARALAMREADLDVTVECVAYGAEEIGLVGSSVDASRRDLETVTAVLNNDGVARGRNLLAYTNGFDALESAVREVTARFDHPVTTDPTPAPHSDHWPFVRRGVPGVHLMSEIGSEGRGWGHTEADTLDKLDPRDLREQAIVLTDLAVELAAENFAVDRREPDAIAADLEAADLAEGMKLVGDWPFTQ